MLSIRSGAIALSLLTAFLASSTAVRAWDYTGHRTVNTAALAALPSDFPAFVHEGAAAERIAFLAGEPDRWRNVPDLPLRHVNGADHYLDLEQVPQAGLDVAKLPSFRYDFVVAFAAGRAAHPESFPAIDPLKNSEHSREWPGFAPWAIAENYGRLKSAFSYLRTFEELGTPEEVHNAQENVVYLMGILGHLVADLAQPLHTTIHHNGWVGDNPHGYTRWPGIHQWIDGGLIARLGLGPKDLSGKVAPATAIALAPRADGRDPMFVAMVDYLVAENARVEPLYQLEKAGKLGPDAADVTEGRAFIEQQLSVGAHMLSSVWLTAWRTSAPDTYLRTQLLKRQNPAAPAAK
jgi:hypothetical protein